MDEKYPLLMLQLESCLTRQNLLNVCLCKGDDEYLVYKADEEKILQWLARKVCLFVYFIFVRFVCLFILF